jgi:hypothetical protein
MNICLYIGNPAKLRTRQTHCLRLGSGIMHCLEGPVPEGMNAIDAKIHTTSSACEQAIHLRID